MSRPEGVWKTHKESCDAQDATMNKASERLRELASGTAAVEGYRQTPDAEFFEALAELVEELTVEPDADRWSWQRRYKIQQALAKVEQECE